MRIWGAGSADDGVLWESSAPGDPGDLNDNRKSPSSSSFLKRRQRRRNTDADADVVVVFVAVTNIGADVTDAGAIIVAEDDAVATSDSNVVVLVDLLSVTALFLRLPNDVCRKNNFSSKPLSSNLFRLQDLPPLLLQLGCNQLHFEKNPTNDFWKYNPEQRLETETVNRGNENNGNCDIPC